MRLGIDADPIGRDGSGNETFMRGLIHGLGEALEQRDALVVAGSRPDALRTFLADQSGLRDRATVAPVRPGALGDLAMGRRFARAGVDVAVGHYNAPLGFAGTIATIVHDISYLRHPETFPPALRARIAWTVRRSVRRSALVVTVSEFSKAELLSAYAPRLTPENVIVTYNAVGPDFMKALAVADPIAVCQRYGLPEVFILAVGNLQPRKNLARLAAAARLLSVPLVVAGRPVWRRASGTAVRDGDIRWLGYVATSDLAALYRACSVFVYPSLYEGFGVPVIEAMAAGAPVVTSDGSALREIAGDAALLVDPRNIDDIAENVRSILDSESLRRHLIEQGHARVRTFRWEDSARVLVQSLRHLVDEDR